MTGAATPGNLDQLLRLFAHQSDEHAIVFLDPDGRVTWWSPGAERVFGFKASQMIGQDASRMFTEEEIANGVPEHEIAVAKSGTAAQDDRWMARADDSRFWAIGAMIALRDENGELVGFAKVLRNRTDLKEQLESLRNKAESSAAAGRRKDRFLSTVSHELRNPLGALVNATEIIRRAAPETPELDLPLRIISRQVENLRRLIDELMDLSRIGAGKVQLNLETVELQNIIERAVETVRPLIEQRRHELDLVLPAAAITVQADPARLEQVFVNLLNNAAKYTEEGGRIWIRATTEGEEAVTHIEDTGIGIDKDLLPRIFKLFTQVESSRAQSQGGLGIGLGIVKQLVALQGGTVQVRSEGAGKGSQFSVRLPLEGRGRYIGPN